MKEIRGGGWSSDTVLIRSAIRGRFTQNDTDYTQGFRLKIRRLI